MRFLTFRRYYLDEVLISTKFYGKVLDVGGKKDNKRGIFRPPLDTVVSWEYLNIDESTNPDYSCSADNIPVDDNTFDIIILAEVVEHLENPIDVLQECYRVLKKDERIIITIPFLNALHADPYDFQRWTDVKIENELSKIGFKNINIQPMGGKAAVIYDLLNFSQTPSSFKTRIFRKILQMISSIFKILDKPNRFITTGYLIEAKK
ncbi:SAM-dependent methyltransferase [Arcobacter sp. CECT 8986]|uniref:methyltransferase domain-containing protein n=1 Tax=Arcobacter sp. CECT 8986 TaxID=2044507 RepID=UPI001009F8A9|nr:class I SAM-dependent methyltransferase [Arcobacter sp. CECT 8986]RXK00105.1 SAM-dependent methyltransferase [Arcobacter sp. CECT 8986]